MPYSIGNDQTVSFDENGVAKVTIKGAGSVTISGLPTGTYEVKETNGSIDGYTWTVTDSENVKTVTAGENAESVTTNTYELNTAKLSIFKKVVSNVAVEGQEFVFDVEIDLSTADGGEKLAAYYAENVPTLAGLTYDSESKTYKGTVTLKDNGMVALTDIPAGASYTVVEQGDGNKVLNKILDGELGKENEAFVYYSSGNTNNWVKLDKDADEKVEITNTLNTTSYNLKLIKTLKLNGVDVDPEKYNGRFEFRLDLMQGAVLEAHKDKFPMTGKKNIGNTVSFQLDDLVEGEYIYMITETTESDWEFTCAEPFYAKVVVGSENGEHKVESVSYHTDISCTDDNVRTDGNEIINYRNTTELAVTKTVSWNVEQSKAPEAGAEFTFKVTLDGDYEPTTDVTLTESKAESAANSIQYSGSGVYLLKVTLDADEIADAQKDGNGNRTADCGKLTITGIPTNTKYTVEEVVLKNAAGDDGEFYTNHISKGEAAEGKTFLKRDELQVTIEDSNVGTDGADVRVYNRYFRSLLVDISTTKSWGPVTIVDSLIPTYVDVQLNKNGAKEDDARLTPDEWTATFKGLNKWESEGVEYTYTIEELDIDYGEIDKEGLVKFLNEQEDKTMTETSSRAFTDVERIKVKTTVDGKEKELDVFKVLGSESYKDDNDKDVFEVLGVFAADYKADDQNPGTTAENGDVSKYDKFLNLQDDWTRASNQGKATLTIRKVAEDRSTALNGAEFTLTGGMSKYADGVTHTTRAVSDEEGAEIGITTFDFDWNDVGVYTLTETKAPTHYQPGEINKWTVTVTRKLDAVTQNGISFTNKWILNIEVVPENADGSTVVTPDGDISMEVVNDRQKSDLVVGKTYSGNATDSSREWNFTVTMKKPADESWVVVPAECKVIFREGTQEIERKDVALTPGADGAYTMKLSMKAGVTATITGIPVEMTYTVVEDEANQDGYTTTATKNGAAVEATEVEGEAGQTRRVIIADGTVTKDSVDQVIFNNYRYVETRGSLTIVKTVSGGGNEAASKTYTFTVTGPGNYSRTVTITGAGRATLSNLQPGTYFVTEADASIEGYTWTVSGDSDTRVSAGLTATITINNDYEPEIPEIPEEEIPEPDVPLADLPDGDTPLADVPGEDDEEFEIPDEDIPLADVPTTGDNTGFWGLMALFSSMGLALLSLGKKRKTK